MSKKGKWRLEITEDFAASHQLRHYEGKCERMHGHNFGVLVAVQGDTLTPDTELLMDFKELRGHLKSVLAELDHRHLNEVEPFTTCNPSSENLARHIYRGLAAKVAGAGVAVASVTVSEKPGQSATYFEN
ncbi:MAG: 6-carboxytetrahydropterin synthase QueD [Proteobacteria bacterium]|nr:6-carboxytetrahydropterin synthase QueD [Pseudomonadota bacterium]